MQSDTPGRVAGIDFGSVRIGIAISDPSNTIANPLTVLAHVSRIVDAASIAALAAENEAGRIVLPVLAPVATPVPLGQPRPELRAGQRA